MKRIVILVICSLTIAITGNSCKKTKGCMDPKALNKNVEAKLDNGSCTYSKVIFYMSVINPSRPVTVSVGGNNIGMITSQFPSGPGNCSAPGCAVFEFKNGQKLDWIATEPGGLIWTGTIEPNSFSECIKVRVY
jgi:hypothetical protein